MAFISKTDYFGLESVSGLKCVSNSDGKAASVAEAMDEAGTIIASTVYGETASPNNSYVVKSNISATSADIYLGKCLTGNVDIGAPVVLNSVKINTSAGAAPTVDAAGQQVEIGATDSGCIYPIGAFTLPVTHHAQVLFDAFALSGTGCYLQSAGYSCTCNITKATKDGECVAHDVSEGKIEAQLTITQTGSTAPSISAGTGWNVTSPLACDNPDSNYPSWTCTLTKYLSRTTL